MANNNSSLLVKILDKEKDKIQSFKGVMVACSGGLDSTVLLHNLWQIRNLKKNLKIAVTHVNFHLRGEESDGDQKFLEDFCSQRQIELNVYDAPNPHDTSEGESTQEWARRIRYEHFDKLQAQGWLIALAHHHDDVAENVIFRMSRGAFPENLIGMKRLERGFYRPLLSITRSTIKDYAARHNVHFRHDSSNDKLSYSRNKIRLKAMPVLEDVAPGASGRIVKTAEEGIFYAKKLSELLLRAGNPQDLKECGLSFRLYLEARANEKLTMTKPEWKELHRWFVSFSKGKSREHLSSLGTIAIDDNGLPQLIKGLPIKADKDIKAFCGLTRCILVPPNSSIATKVGNSRLTFLANNSLGAEATMMTYGSAIIQLEEKIAGKLKKIL